MLPAEHGVGGLGGRGVRRCEVGCQAFYVETGGSILPTVTAPHSHLLTKAPWTLGLTLVTGVLVPSMFLDLTTLFGCFRPLGSLW